MTDSKIDLYYVEAGKVKCAPEDCAEHGEFRHWIEDDGTPQEIICGYCGKTWDVKDV